MTTLVALANHLWQSTIFAALVALAIVAFRRNRASVRHALWLAASIKFLLPFAALATLGAQLAPTVLAPRTQASIAMAIDSASQPFAGARFELPAPPPGVPAPTPTAWPIAPIAGTIWAAGSLLILAAWGLKWRRVSRLVRGGQPIISGREVDALRQLERQAGLTRPIAIVESPGRFEPGVFGIRRPVLLWPAAIGTHLGADQLVTILAHEVAHVRRRDNLTAAIQTVISALFWFHPLVWWIGARLADERERACDEEVLHEVLRTGGEPELYAESILAVCRLYLQAPPSCVAGVANSNLRTRIERIMTGAATRALSWRHKLLLAAVTFATLATPMAVGALTSSSLTPARLRFMQVEILHRQAATAGAPGQVMFEVSSVKVNNSGPGPISVKSEPSGRFTARNVTLRTLIQIAYRLQAAQLVGGPGWLNADRFDVVATGNADGSATLIGGESGSGPNRMNQMLQALLADRFKLVVRSETRELPIYALKLASSAGKLGPELRPSASNCAGNAGNAQNVVKLPADPADPMPCGIRLGLGTLVAGGVPLQQLTSSLSGVLDRTVVDRTDLAGSFDVTLKWTPDMATPGLAQKAAYVSTIDPNGPSIFTAMQEQLGLKLEPTKGPVDILVIVSAQLPSGN